VNYRGGIKSRRSSQAPDLEGHRKRLREALGNTLSDEFVGATGRGQESDLLQAFGVQPD
jgi:hypothetical protein